MSLLIAKVVITERMSFTHAMQQIAANGKSWMVLAFRLIYVNLLTVSATIDLGQ